MECYLETMVKQNVKCCACEGSLEGTKHMNICITGKVAHRLFPTASNVLIQNAPHNAVAIVCDNCIEAKTSIKFVIEAEPGYTKVIYHKLEDLEDEPQWFKDIKERLSRPSPSMN